LSAQVCQCSALLIVGEETLQAFGYQPSKLSIRVRVA
jgi:hypothetical protein